VPINVANPKSNRASAGTMDPMRPQIASYLERLRAELTGIGSDMGALIDRSSIRTVNPNDGGSDLFFVGAADWGWGPDFAAAQMRLLRRYHEWFERFRFLFPHPTPAVASTVKKADEFVRRWIERRDVFDHSIPRTLEEARTVAARELGRFDVLLDIAAKSGTDVLRLVPDTNALIRNPDLASYSRTAPSPSFVVHLVPTVLGELDDLKDRGKTQELRDQAQSVVRRLKGLRDKGNLATGVALTKGITVRAEAREVDVHGVLDWLDPTVADDRLLAAALRLQSDHVAGIVVLVTSTSTCRTKPMPSASPTWRHHRASRASAQSSTPPSRGRPRGRPSSRSPTRARRRRETSSTRSPPCLSTPRHPSALGHGPSIASIAAGPTNGSYTASTRRSCP
jgi:hypothetical protein